MPKLSNDEIDTLAHNFAMPREDFDSLSDIEKSNYAMMVRFGQYHLQHFEQLEAFKKLVRLRILMLEIVALVGFVYFGFFAGV